MSTLLDLEEAFYDIKRSYEANEISKEEYKNLLEGLEVEKVAVLNAEEMQKKEELNSYIQNAIAVVSMVA
jgi:hypothetical protein